MSHLNKLLLSVGVLILSAFTPLLSAFSQSSVGYRIDCSKVAWKFSASENHATAQTNNELVASPGAGLSLYITNIEISNGATAGTIKIVEDTGGTPVDKWEELYAGINGGAVVDRSHAPIKITANTNLGFTSGTVTTHSVSVAGCIAP